MKSSHREMPWGLLSLLLSCLVPIIAGTAWGASEMSQLRADGRIIRDGSGRAVMLKGLNVEMHNWAYKDATYSGGAANWQISDEAGLVMTLQEMNDWLLIAEDLQRMKEWGANVVRLQVPHYFFESFNSPGQYHEWAFAKLNEWLTTAADIGMYVIIDLHVPYGGRQYSCEDAAHMEGKTLWLESSHGDHVKNLWKTLAKRTKNQWNVLFELINEPYPRNAGISDSAWWTLAQELIETIRTEGAEQIIIAASPLPYGPFVKVTDGLNNIAYDFHFYLPFEFTHQQAFWMPEPYPPANYPYPDKWEWLASTYDRDEADFEGSQTWTEWRETFSTAEELYCRDPSSQDCPPPTHIRPTLSSYDNIGLSSFDNVQLLIDGVGFPIGNPGFETGDGSFPDGWTQWGQDGTEEAFWDGTAANRM